MSLWWKIKRHDAHEILHRLFFEEDVRLFEALPVAFRCSCSFERVENTLRMLGHDEICSIIEEWGAVDVTCEFCIQKYVFDAVDVEALFADSPMTANSSLRHRPLRGRCFPRLGFTEDDDLAAALRLCPVERLVGL